MSLSPAAFGVAFGILYRALTLITGRRRRKRSADPGSHDLTSADYVEEKTGDAVIDTVSDLLWWGKNLNFVFEKLRQGV